MFRHITGEKGGVPVKVGVAVTDILTGHYAQSAILAALLRRGRTGKGSRVECSLFESQVCLHLRIWLTVDRFSCQYWRQLLDRWTRSDSMGYFASVDRTLPSLPYQRLLLDVISWK